MSNHLDWEIFDFIQPDVEVTVDNENQTINLVFGGQDNIRFCSLLSKLSKHCRNCANNIYNYPIRTMTTTFRGKTMVFDIHISSTEIHDYYLIFEEIFNAKGSASIWDKLTGYPVIASPNSLSATNVSNLTTRSQDNNKLPISEYFSNQSLDDLYSHLTRSKSVSDYEIKGYLTSEMMNPNFPKEEMKRYDLGINARFIQFSGKPCVVCSYKLK